MLDVGSGSGFLTAVFGLLVAPNGKVIGIDHIQGCMSFAYTSTKLFNLVNEVSMLQNFWSFHQLHSVRVLCLTCSTME